MNIIRKLKKRLFPEPVKRDKPLQVITVDAEGNIIYTSYFRNIAKKDKYGKVTLDRELWNLPGKTGQGRDLFLGEDRYSTLKRIESGEYALADLN